jgi:predicted dehydrogenase
LCKEWYGVRFGLIGCGWIVERCHAPSINRVDGMEVAAVADPAPGRAELVGSLFGLTGDDCLSDYRELLAREDIDAVSIGTPPATHREIVEAVAAAGKHAICEKPLATTLADADAAITAADNAGIKLAMYHNYLYYHGPRVAQELIAAGAIGTVIATEIRGMGLRPWVGNEAYRPGWRFTVDEGGGGALMDAGVHALYLTELLHGSPIASVSAAMNNEESGIDASAFCQLRMANGGIGTVHIGWLHGDAGFSIQGTDGYIVFVYDEPVGYFGFPVRAIRVFREGRPTETHHLPLEFNVMEPQLYRDLVETLVGRADSYPAFARDGRRSLEVAVAAYISDARRTIVELPIPASDPVYERGLAALR